MTIWITPLISRWHWSISIGGMNPEEDRRNIIQDVADVSVDYCELLQKNTIELRENYRREYANALYGN